MFNLIIYSNSYKKKNQIINPFLNISAKNKYKFYMPYYCIDSKTSLHPKKYTENNFYTKRHADEWLTRTRRVIQFSDQTNLRLVKYSKKEFGEIFLRVSSLIHCDHVTYWINEKGAKFILNEPYYIEDDYWDLLKNANLDVFKIPENNSPYCGRWDPTPNAKSTTSSYLICDQSHFMDLFLISVALENPSLLPSTTKRNLSNPIPWNSLKGIKHV